MTQATDKNISAESEASVDAAPAKSKAQQSTTIAVIFDSSRKNKVKRGLVVPSKKTDPTFASIVTFAPLPTEDMTGNEFSMSVKDDEKLKMTYGLNMEISLKVWTAQNSDRFKNYQSSGAFEVYKPRKGREANAYIDFEENDAINLVLGTISVAQLDKYAIGETREAVLREIREQKSAIQGNLEAIKAKNERSANI